MKNLIVLALLIPAWVSQSCGQTGKAPTRKDVESFLKKSLVTQAGPGLDGATTIEIIDVRIGKPRKWQYNDGGDPAEGHNTDLWPIRVHYKYRTHYRARTNVSERHWGYSMFRDGFDQWVMSVSSYPGQPANKYYDEPSTMQ